ncbi:carboxypeptidase-like regulatory domain-containing protein [Mucilaginibacter psychrotolerans]|uniref:Carboxypeptidase-like regulatory domain-containing protein n=1 Tax=Mucilaginibacter psychrotolerans TaxID=1524096 RepID=A0A4Y8SDX4_9SPHI|nr:carboxypeptidase-like regulatory domain-containing protein [Mucilaginibacter psychrotolerans]TFF36576.1 hypothetical protein E2R66_15595 [Mucilaginibacter psychrotolerans]
MRMKLLQKLKKLRRLYIPPFVLMLFCIAVLNCSFAQAAAPAAVNTTRVADIIVTGRVLDEQKQPLPAVNISIAGTTVGTVTDVNGKFIITKVWTRPGCSACR